MEQQDDIDVKLCIWPDLSNVS